jgi:hypothetical protein
VLWPSAVPLQSARRHLKLVQEISAFAFVTPPAGMLHGNCGLLSIYCAIWGLTAPEPELLTSLGPECNDVLIERQRVFHVLRRRDRRDGELAAVGFRFVEGVGTRNFAGDLEIAYFVREAVRSHRGWSSGDLEMKMRHNRVAGIADQSEHLTKFDMVAAMHLDTARLQVSIERVAMIT